MNSKYVADFVWHRLAVMLEFSEVGKHQEDEHLSMPEPVRLKRHSRLVVMVTGEVDISSSVSNKPCTY